MGYSENDGSVRVDFFRPSGKWYTTEAINMRPFYGEQFVHTAFSFALDHELQKHSILHGQCRHCEAPAVNASAHCRKAPHRLAGMFAVCLEPYHPNSVPLMVRVPGDYNAD